MEGSRSNNSQAPNDDGVSTNLAGVKHTLAVMSGKGGVGKTTIAVNLALALSRSGHSVGLLDADIHGPNVPKMLGMESERLDGDENGILPAVIGNVKVFSMGFLLQNSDTPVIWRGPMKMGALRQFLGEVRWGDLDYLIIDLPPGTGDEPLSIAQLLPDNDGAVIVTTPQDVALLDSRKSITFARTLGMPVIGVVENMSGFTCPHCGEHTDLFKSGGGEDAAREMGVPFLGRIPFDPQVVEAEDSGRTIDLLEGGSSAVGPINEVVKNIKANLEARKDE